MPVDRAQPENSRLETTRPANIRVETTRPEFTEQGGDPVCWMHLLCPACGAMPESAGPDGAEPDPGTCPRCGEELER